VSTTRLLLLGVLMDRSMHGYEVRRELELWQAELWANIAYGSIYFGLKKMAGEGLLEAVEEEGRSGSSRTVYTITPAGRQEFHRLLSEHWWSGATPKDPFIAALTFMPRLETPELLAALRHRLATLRSVVEIGDYRAEQKEKLAGPHVAEIIRLGKVRCQAELSWLEELIGKVERGELP
jgi:DNA-binding PadR family transcriptional regulator